LLTNKSFWNFFSNNFRFNWFSRCYFFTVVGFSILCIFGVVVRSFVVFNILGVLSVLGILSVLGVLGVLCVLCVLDVLCVIVGSFIIFGIFGVVVGRFIVFSILNDFIFSVIVGYLIVLYSLTIVSIILKSSSSCSFLWDNDCLCEL
jgi:hypothetical protein